MSYNITTKEIQSEWHVNRFNGRGRAAAMFLEHPDQYREWQRKKEKMKRKGIEYFNQGRLRNSYFSDGKMAVEVMNDVYKDIELSRKIFHEIHNENYERDFELEERAKTKIIKWMLKNPDFVDGLGFFLQDKPLNESELSSSTISDHMKYAKKMLKEVLECLPKDSKIEVLAFFKP